MHDHRRDAMGLKPACEEDEPDEAVGRWKLLHRIAEISPPTEWPARGKPGQAEGIDRHAGRAVVGAGGAHRARVTHRPAGCSMSWERRLRHQRLNGARSATVTQAVAPSSLRG